MSPSFKTILVPVDFSINTDVAIAKAIELIDFDGCIHLLHVTKKSINKKDKNYLNKEQVLGEWKTSIEEYLPSLAVYCSIIPGTSISNCIKGKAEQINADLIILGKRDSHTLIGFFQKVIPSKIARETGKPVLTVKPGCLHNKIRTLLVPITDNLPEHTREAMIILSRKFDLRIHLVTFAKSVDEEHEEQVNLLSKNCEWLKEMTHCSPEYAVLKGANKARSILAYANKINADILIVHPTAENKIGWFAGRIPDVRQGTSNLQVLAVE